MTYSPRSDHPVTPFDFGYSLDQGSPLDPGMHTYATVADLIAVLEKGEGVELSELEAAYPDPQMKERVLLDALITASAFIDARLSGCGISPIPVPGCQPILRKMAITLARRFREIFSVRENVELDYQEFVVKVLDDICAGLIILPGTVKPIQQPAGVTPPYALGACRCGYNPFWRR